MRMQRLGPITALAALTCALVLPGVAAAGPVTGPPSAHERIVQEFVDDDFCGTGEDVATQFEVRATVWEREDAFKVVFNDKTWFTYNDVTLVLQFTGLTVEMAAPTQSGATETIEVIETGLRANLKLANGRVLTSDHGLLHYLISFDENGNFLDVEVLRDRGGHPAFLDDVLCEAATAAFGIPYPG